MEKIIITGGAGFIGSHLADALIAREYEVHVIDSLVSGKKENLNKQVMLHVADIRNKEEILPIFKDAKYVFHLAALPQVEYSMKNPIETNEVNVIGLLNVLEACRLNEVKRLVFASSSAIYGEQNTMPLIETMKPNPLSPYGAQKYIGEIYCKLWAKIYGLETVSLRYFNVYGIRQNPEGAYASVVAKFIELRKLGKPLTIVNGGNQTRDFVSVLDVAEANILAMLSLKVGQGEVINIGGTKEYSVNYIAELIGGPTIVAEPRIEPEKTLSDIRRAKELLDWEPKVEFEKGVLEIKKHAKIA